MSIRLRILNILSYVWKNPIVQFSCFILLKHIVALFHQSTKNKFKRRRHDDACEQDYSVGTNEDDMIEQVPEDDQKENKPEVKVERKKRPRRKKTTQSSTQKETEKPRRIRRTRAKKE